MSQAETFAPRNGLEIAVIGMACRFPGAGSAAQFWRNLRDGVESISFFTDAELLAAGVEPTALRNPNLVKAGGILRDIELFDAEFFGYSPREAEIIDPQQRLFLECAWEALDDAGHGPAACDMPVGVFAGAGTSGYVVNIYSNYPSIEAADSFQIANGNDKDYLATRVSYKLNLKGPSVTVQTACSTSLAATHLACQSLLSGACDMALAGGATVGAAQKTGYLYREGGILSPDGHTRAFDALARGCVGGSGVGVVVLRRLEDALADGDTIHAVIKGSAMNNDGALKVGFTAPSVDGQAAVITAALAVAEVSPEMLSYVEAHGTATPLGDPVEVAGLTQAFRAWTRKKSFCALGSVKTNVGHLDAAAGVAGLMKTVLALKHKQLPPSLHFREGNPQIEFADSPFKVNAALRDWSTEGTARYAGVSSFGIGGTNVHAVLEEAPPAPPVAPSRDWQLLTLSAKTKSALETMSADLAAAVEAEPRPDLADVAYTLQTGRSLFDHRRVVVCRDAGAARRALEAGGRGEALTGFQESRDKGVVFMFPGQGAQRVDMGRGLYESEREFREHIDLCCELLEPHTAYDLRRVLYPAPGEAEHARQRMNQTEVAQVALFAVESALAAQWAAWGVTPRAMIGHSLGEYVAAYMAGVLTLEDALRLVSARGRLMQSAPRGSMLAVGLPASELRAMLNDYGLSLAAVNGPSACVVSGAHESCEGLARDLDSRGVVCKTLHTSHAFHSRSMEPILKPFADAVRGVALGAPRIPYVSNLTGTWVTGDEARDPNYWVRHLRETVLFGEGLGELLSKEPDSVLLELGPGDTLAVLAGRHPGRSERNVVLSSLSRARSAGEKSSDVFCMLHALGRLWLGGARVDWRGFYAHEKRRRVSLPSYPFERKRYWIERRHDAALAPARPSPREKRELADWFHVPVWRQTLAPSLSPPVPATQTHGARWLLFADGGGIASRMAEQLEGEGNCVVTVVRGERFGKAGERAYTLEPESRDDYDALFKEFGAASQRPDFIVHLWAAEEARGPDAERVERAQRLGFFSLLYIAQAAGEQLLARALEGESRGDALSIAVVSNRMHRAPGDERSSPEWATILGPCRVIPQEYPNVTCRSIDLDLGSPLASNKDELAAQLISELKSQDAERVVAYRGRARWSQDFEPLRLGERGERPPRLRERGVYLITGGLGGVGLEAAEYLARAARARLILIGRSPFPERALWQEWLETHDAGDEVGGKIERLRAFEALGAEVLTISADVSVKDELRAAVERAEKMFGRVNGVVHAAGVAPRSIMQRTTREMAAAVLAPKLQGTLALAEVFGGAGLDFLLLCSSMRALTGGVGAADYCAANAFLDAFAQASDVGREAVVTSVNWDGWADVGMSLRASARAELRPGAGGEGMTASEGVDALERILWLTTPRVVVSTRDLAATLEEEQGLDAARAIEELQQAPTPAAMHPRPDLETSYAPPRNAVEQTLVSIWQSLLGIEPVGIHDNFFDLGGDSVISIQIIGRANHAGLRLTPKQIFEHQTVAELSAACSGAAAEAPQGLVTGDVPLTPIQHWFFERRMEAPHHFNQAVLLKARRDLNYDLLRGAVAALLRHHDALRFRFTRDGDEWRQVASEEVDAPCELIDLSACAEEEVGRAVEAEASRLQASLNLTNGPLLRVALMRRGPDGDGRLLVVAHHLVIDAFSWRILLEDIKRAYQQLSRGESVQLPPKTTSFKQWAERLAGHARSGAHTAADFWLGMARHGAAALPVDYDGDNTAGSARDVTVSLDEDETRALLRRVQHERHAQVDEALMTALLGAFEKWLGRPSLLVAVEGHGRDSAFADVDLSRTVGWFTTIYPVRLDGEAGESAAVRLSRVRDRLRQARDGGLDYGLLRYLSGEGKVADELRESLRAEVSFLYLGQLDRALSESSVFAPAEEGTGIYCDPRNRRSHLLEVVALVSGGRLRVTWVYSANVHRAATVESLAADFLSSLRALAADERPGAAEGIDASDFAAFGWGREDLDGFVEKINESLK
jgi:non-ribosomal peptide synthase protein (TIGR01720 family)